MRYLKIENPLFLWSLILFKLFFHYLCWKQYEETSFVILQHCFPDFVVPKHCINKSLGSENKSAGFWDIFWDIFSMNDLNFLLLLIRGSAEIAASRSAPFINKYLATSNWLFAIADLMGLSRCVWTSAPFSTKNFIIKISDHRKSVF